MRAAACTCYYNSFTIRSVKYKSIVFYKVDDLWISAPVGLRRHVASNGPKQDRAAGESFY